MIGLLTFPLFISLSGGFPQFAEKIPNGKNVPHPCTKDGIWDAIGHELPKGPGPRNQFGIDFQSEGNKWTKVMCEKDSDGDGRSNGEELGDPDCSWVEGGTPSVTDRSQLSHPGVCDPIGSPNCGSKDSFLKILPACRESGYHWCPPIKEPDVMTMDLKFDDEPIPNLDTVYYCQRFSIPDDETYHVIAYEVINDNPDLLHHVVVMTCTEEGELEELLNKEESWEKPGFCDMAMDTCAEAVFVWGYGAQGRCYRSDIGFPMGKNSIHTFIIQNHYNNPYLRSGIRDSSGLRLYYSKKHRENEGAMMTVGQVDIVVPPKSVTSVSSRAFLGTDTNCGHSYLEGHDEYRVTGLLFHMHLIGTHAKVDIIKASGERETLIDRPVIYDRPPIVLWTEDDAPILKPGDDIEVNCTFDSRHSKEHKDNYTLFGEATNDEMCIVFMEIFPRPNNLPGQSLFNVGDMNDCLYYDFDITNIPDEIHGCSEFLHFGSIIDNIAENAKLQSEFLQHCRSNVYPATYCTKQCYLSLEKHGLLEKALQPCMKGLVFRFYAGFWISDDFQDVYFIQSHATRCMEINDISEAVDTEALRNMGNMLETAMLSFFLFICYLVEVVIDF